MAAGVAAGCGRQVTVLERNAKVGRKLRIAGKGRCNITNDTDVDGLQAAIPGNPKFLLTAFYHFGPQDVIAFFNQLGLPTKTERGGRVFPISDDANDVVQALIKFCRQAGVRFQHNTSVQRVFASEGRAAGVITETGAKICADAVILATGGASYPGTGSTGDGYRIARELGHAITPIRPALAPLETEESWPAEAQGLSLRNVSLTAWTPEGKERYQALGEMLFTHFGVSGPLVLSASRHVARGSRLAIDLKPGLTPEQLDDRVLREFEKYNRREFGNALGDLLPRALIPIIVRLSRIGHDTPVHQLTRAQRLAFEHLLKNLTLTVKGPRSFAEAIITAGGVSVKEIDPRTMASKLLPGLHFAGEVIDVDGYTGGYNLQIAWSTGHLAGMHAGQ